MFSISVALIDSFLFVISRRSFITFPAYNNSVSFPCIWWSWSTMTLPIAIIISFYRLTWLVSNLALFPTTWWHYHEVSIFQLSFWNCICHENIIHLTTLSIIMQIAKNTIQIQYKSIYIYSRVLIRCSYRVNTVTIVCCDLITTSKTQFMFTIQWPKSIKSKFYVILFFKWYQPISNIMLWNCQHTFYTIVIT